MKKIGLIVVQTFAIFALLPVIIIVGLIYILVSIVFQPYFYKRDRRAVDEEYQKAIMKGEFIDYPPKIKFGHLFGPGSGMFKYLEENEDTDELE
ncbi:MAG: hypothetical protein HDT04_04245 [Bacteroidales bacterium]|nr:hypothetical protein [Bacteroidales bacterium]